MLPNIVTDIEAQHLTRDAERAVYVVFIGAGLGFASWASEIPRVRDNLNISPGTLGLLLLSIAAGSIVSLPLAGMVVHRLGEARTVALMSVVMAAGLAIVAIGYRFTVAPVAVGLFAEGFGMGGWDVAMNVQGAAVERRLQRSVMSRFHAGFSVGTVAGAGIGALVIAVNVPVTVHLLAAAVLVAAVVPESTRRFLPTAPAPAPAPALAPEPAPPESLPPATVQASPPPAAPRRQLAAWTEDRTLLIGLFVLCMAFTEGTSNDWLSLAVIDGYHRSAAIGTVTFSVFLAAMTIGRWFGPAALDRFGRVTALRTSAAVALTGLLLVVFGNAVAQAIDAMAQAMNAMALAINAMALAIIGAALWGLGTALGFPTGMSAASDDPQHAAARVSVVASIGYVAFLAGPPSIGLLGNHVGVLRALLLAAGLLAVGVLVAGATAPHDG